MPDYLSRDDAAAYLRCSLRKIDRLKASGRLPYRKMDGNTLFRQEHVEALIYDAPVAQLGRVTRISNDSAELPNSLTRTPSRRAEAA